MRKRAVHALSSHTSKAIDNLKKDEDEMLRGQTMRLSHDKHAYADRHVRKGSTANYTSMAYSFDCLQSCAQALSR